MLASFRSFRLPAVVCSVSVTFLLGILGNPARGFSDAAIVASLASEFRIDPITAPGEDGGRVAQMAWGPDGPGGETRLYVATMDQGIFRFDYSATGPSTNRVRISAIPALGIGFHSDPDLSGEGGAVLYLSEFRGTDTEAILRRITDSNGDGEWGGANDLNQEVVNNIPLGSVPYGHHMNQIQILGSTLYVGIGVGSDQGNNENAYTGTVSWIQDLTLLSGDTTTPNLAGLPITDFRRDPSPFTSVDPGKLRVHSSGTRNPFGLAIDGDDQVWVTINQIDRPRPGTEETTVPQDQIYRIFEKADYTYRDGVAFPHRNSIHDWRLDPLVIAAGFYDPRKRALSLTADLPDPNYRANHPGASSPLPHGIGPHSSADGFDFYRGNGLPLKWHKDAFVTRQSERIAPPLGPFEDVASVDSVTGEVIQIATGFAGPLDILADALGNLLVGEVGGGSQTRLYRISPVDPISTAHPFQWVRDGDGLWIDPQGWDLDYDGDGKVDPASQTTDRRFPHAWGIARYSVTIDRPSNPTVTLNRNAKIETLVVGDELRIQGGSHLTVSDLATVEPEGSLGGRGAIDGSLLLKGTLAPGTSQTPTGAFGITGNLRQESTGRIELEIGGDSPPDHDLLSITGEARLAGTLDIQLRPGTEPDLCDKFDLLIAGSLVDDEYSVTFPSGTSLMSFLTPLDDGRVALRVAVAPLDPRVGTVNCGEGAIADVLSVNGSVGGSERRVEIGLEEMVTVSFLAPPRGPNPASYGLWVWLGEATNPSGFPILFAGQLLGCSVGPTPFQPNASPQPDRCVASPGAGPLCRGTVSPSGPSTAPWTVAHPGFANPIILTVQGLVQDRGAGNSIQASLTNAVQIRIE